MSSILQASTLAGQNLTELTEYNGNSQWLFISMTELLQQVIAEVSKLSDEQQDAIALHNPARSRLINCHSSPKGEQIST